MAHGDSLFAGPVSWRHPGGRLRYRKPPAGVIVRTVPRPHGPVRTGRRTLRLRRRPGSDVVGLELLVAAGHAGAVLDGAGVGGDAIGIYSVALVGWLSINPE